MFAVLLKGHWGGKKTNNKCANILHLKSNEICGHLNFYFYSFCGKGRFLHGKVCIHSHCFITNDPIVADWKFVCLELVLDQTTSI